MPHRKTRVRTDLLITGVSAAGSGLAEAEGIEVPGTIPGDRVDAKVVRRAAHGHRAKPFAFHQRGGNPALVFCPHFGTCGGCAWQHVSYPTQLEWKEAMVRRVLGESEVPEAADLLSPIMAAPEDREYRNRLDFSFSSRRWLLPHELGSEDTPDRAGLGFHIPGRYDRVLGLQVCHLHDLRASEVRATVDRLALGSGVPFIDPVTHDGILRSLTLRSTRDGQLLLILMVSTDAHSALPGLFRQMETELAGVTGAVLAVSDARNDSLATAELRTLWGESTVTERCGHIRLSSGPLSFAQTNPAGAERLYAAAEAAAGLDAEEALLDLYCGTGGIGLYLARRCREVTGVELVAEAVQFAQRNAEANGIGNATFVLQSAEEAAAAELPAADVVVVDPPRAGLHPKVAEALCSHPARRLVYVSCNHRSFARDLAILGTTYAVTGVQPVDMFPQTRHVELVARLERRSASSD